MSSTSRTRDEHGTTMVSTLIGMVLELDQGTGLVRWSVTDDGDLVVQRAEASTPAWETVPAQTLARDVDPNVFVLDPDPAHDGRLVHVELAAGLRQIATAASVSR